MRLYGTLDLLLAALYAWLGWAVLAGRSRAFDLALALVVSLLLAGGVAMLLQAPFARRLGLLAAAAALGLGLALLVLLALSAAYLYGIFGGLGRGLAYLCGVVAVVVADLFLLVPAFQLRHLRRLGRE